MTIYEKVAKIQDKIQKVKKDSENPHFHNTYATYEKVIDTVYPLLRKQGLVSYHTFVKAEREGIITVVTTIRETDGTGIIESSLEMPITKQDPQAAGSAITYAKRYSLLAMLGLGTEDDDAEKAADRKPVEAVQKTVFDQDDALERLSSKGCPKCGAKMVRNPHTDKIFCSKKCWLKEGK